MLWVFFRFLAIGRGIENKTMQDKAGGRKVASRSLFPPSRALPVRMRICFFSAARASFVPPCHDSVPANAEKTAKQFAENSHSKINKIVEAGQGEFSIDDADIAYKKKIRVVSTITYSLKD